MNPNRILLLLVLLLHSIRLHAADPLTETFQKGLFEEEANRDLAAAVKAYEDVVLQLDGQRKLAATAVFRLGECYRKLGRTNDAITQFQRIVREYSDDETLARLSRQNLAGLGTKASAPAAPSGDQVAQSQSASEIALLEIQLEELKKYSAADLPDLILTLFKAPRLEQFRAEFMAWQKQLDTMRPGRSEQHPDVLAAGELLKLSEVRLQEAAREFIAAKEVELTILKKTAAKLESNQATTRPAGDIAAQRAALEGEMELARQQLEIVKKQVAVGRATTEESIKAEREVLRLQRELAALPVSPSGSATAATTVTREEAEELTRMRALIQRSPDLINTPPLNGEPPLFAAARSGYLEVVKLLLANGADPGFIATTPKGKNTPLGAAAEAGQKAVVDELLRAGAKPNGGLRAPLSLAAEKGFESICVALLDAGADPMGDVAPGFASPFNLAVGSCRTNLVALFIQRGAHISWNELAFAIDRERKDMLDLLLAQVSVAEMTNELGQTLLHWAAAPKQSSTRLDPAFAETLLKQGCKADAIDSRGETPLWAALLNERPVDDPVEVVRLLLKAGADPNHRPSTSRYVQPEVPASIQSGFQNTGRRTVLPVNTGKDTLLAVAVRRAWPKTAAELLATGAKAAWTNEDGRTLLHEAARLGLTPMVAPLVKAGLSVDGADRQGYTPLFTAIYDAKSSDTVEALLRAGADPDKPVSGGYTPLHSAVSVGSLKLVQALLAAKADPNRLNEDLNSPLDLTGTTSPRSAPVGRGAVSGARPVPGGPNNQPPKTEIAAALRAAGAKENLRRTQQIVLRQPGTGAPYVTMDKRRDDVTGSPTLGRLFADVYSSRRSAESRPQFPDFSDIRIQRMSPSGGEDLTFTADLTRLMNGESGTDVPLQWGDIVEIGEVDHALSQAWAGLPETTAKALAECTAQAIRVHIGGVVRRVEVKLANHNDDVLRTRPIIPAVPGIPPHRGQRPPAEAAPESDGPIRSTYYLTPWLMTDLLRQNGLLRTSSDLSRFTVRRGAARQPQTEVFDVSGGEPGGFPFWLRDGDVIEIPEKR